MDLNLRISKIFEEKKIKFKVGDNTISKGVEYVVTDIDKETGRVDWDVNYLPNLEELLEIATKLFKISKEVYVKAKDDPKFREIYEESSNLRNKIRTHIRNEYPEDYKRIVTNINEMSTTGGGIGAASFTPGTGVQYATPFAFKKFKYKLVPKDKNDNYVQKGLNSEALNLFENDFQNKRVNAFNLIEKELNDIYKMISNSKNKTIEYYKNNPTSFKVQTPTDLILEYLIDIKKLLKEDK
jgi:hypothetical protein